MTITRSLQEVVLAVHFANSFPITVLDVANWISEFGGAEPELQQLPSLPPAALPVPNQAVASGFQLVASEEAGLPRFRARGREPNTFYVFQHDRFGMGWQRNVEIGEAADYPGYDQLREIWARDLGRFSAWLSNRLSAPLVPNLVELTYNNAYPIVVEGRQRRLNEILALVDAGYRTLNSFHLVWSENVGSPSEGFVMGQVGLGNVPPGQRVVAVNYYSLAAIGATPGQASSVEHVMRSADKLHQRILDIHAAAVVSDA